MNNDLFDPLNRLAAQPRRDLFPGIMERLTVKKPAVIGLRTVYATAAAVLLIIALNFFLLASHSERSSGQGAAESVARYYNILPQESGI